MKSHRFRKLLTTIVCLFLLSVFFLIKKTNADSVESTNLDNAEFAVKVVNKSESNKNFDTDEDEIFDLVNSERQKNNLNELAWDNQLSEIARNYSRQMADENFFDHFDPQGADVVMRAKQANLKHWSKIGENLFSVANLRNFDRFAVKNWMLSPTHRQNILDADFNTAGIGIAESASGEVFITQVFIRR